MLYSEWYGDCGGKPIGEFKLFVGNEVGLIAVERGWVVVDWEALVEKVFVFDMGNEELSCDSWDSSVNTF